jgi:hypothetical protein
MQLIDIVLFCQPLLAERGGAVFFFARELHDVLALRPSRAM